MSITVFCSCYTYGQRLDIDSSLEKINKNDCIAVLRVYRDYWKADSLGNTGFRVLLGWNFLRHCNCLEGTKWEAISEYLGKPNRIFTDEKMGQFYIGTI
jgi:hypothetical protein